MAHSRRDEDKTKQPTRRTILGTAPLLALVAVTGVAGATDGKMSKEDAQYRPSPNGQERCGNCVHLTGLARCNVVSGTVSRSGWCRLYQKA